MKIFENFSSEIIYAVYISIAVILTMIIAEIGKKKFKIATEYTRKFVHVTSGLITLSYPYVFTTWFIPFLLSASFIILLIITKKNDLMTSVNGIERESHGTPLFTIAVFTSFLVSLYMSNKVFFILPIIIFTLADPMAAIIGMRTKWIPYKVGNVSKSVGGSIAFFIVAFLTSYFSFDFLTELSITNIFIYSFIISVVTMFVEAISKNGVDNFTIPMSAIIILYLIFSISGGVGF